MLRTASLRALALTLFLVLGATFASAKIVYVNQNAPGPARDGTSWAKAFLTVQAGLNAAALDDEVWVAKGTYLERIEFIQNIGLYGGFVGTETERSQRDWKANATVLEAPDGEVVKVERYFGSSFVGIVVDGFSIRNRNDTLPGVGYAVIVRNAPNKVTLANNTISGNPRAIGLSSECTATLINNTVHQGRILIRDGATATLTGNVIRDGGTAVYAYNSGTVSMIGNTVIGNVLIVDSKIFLTNNIVAFSSGFGIHAGPGAFVSLSHNNVFGNTSGNYYNLSDPTGTGGNISEDPLFSNRAAGDFRLPRNSPCIDAGDDFAVAPGQTDADGRPRSLGTHVDIGAFEYQVIPDPPISISLGSTSHSAPAVYRLAVYAGTDDGKLHAYGALSGQPLPGFPLDLSAALGQPVTFNSRPALYAGSSGMAIYLTTKQGHVAKVSLDGRLLWSLRPLPGHTRSTPAVTPDGDVLVSFGWEDAPPSAMNLAFRLDERTGQPKSISPYLGSSTPENPTDRSPAVVNRYVYINGTGHGRGGLVVLNQDNLTVRAEFAPDEEALPPFFFGSSLFLATRSGNLHKVNAVTFALNESFGWQGTVRLGTEATTPPQIGWDGNLYVGTSQGQVFRVQMATGATSLFYATSPADAITGLVVERSSGVMAVGTKQGRFIRIPMADSSKAQVEQLTSGVVGGPVYNPADGRFYLTTEDGHLIGRPVL